MRQQLCSTASDDDGSSAPEERAKDFLSEVVLCHNDLLSGNVLHADGWERVQVSGTGAGCNDETDLWSVPAG